jgi:hypothetical protein
MKGVNKLHDQAVASLLEDARRAGEAGRFSEAEEILKQAEQYREVKGEYIALYLSWAKSGASEAASSDAQRALERLLTLAPNHRDGLALAQKEDALLGPSTDSDVPMRLSSTIGIAPLALSYSILWLDPRECYFLWIDNGKPVSNASNGQMLLTTPGEHKIEVLVTTQDGRDYRFARTVTVLERVTPVGDREN